MGEAQSTSAMLHHRDQPLNSAYGGKGGSSEGSSSSLRNRKCDKDGNFNFLPGKDNEGTAGGGDENRNPVRPRNLGPLGRDPPNSSSSSSSSSYSAYHHNPGLLSPRSRLPCWSRLEPLPEIECGDDGYGRVPPEGAEEGRLQEEERRVMMSHVEEMKMETQRRKSSMGREEEEDLALQEDEDEWGDSDSESEVSNRSGGSVSSITMDSGGEGMLMGGWDRIGVGEPKSNPQECDPSKNGNREPAGGRRSLGRKSLTGSNLGNLLEEGGEDEGADRSSDSEGEMPELVDAVWTLRDRERFKAQEMEKHQVQLTMYRRLALIRWVRTLQGRIQEQQNRLQSSFDVILTQRKELLRMGAAATVANSAAPVAVASQS
ncbi:UPF0500 protein C1orf216 homolog isoform X2 [Cyclopterus lumpus]|uniref:UPF0500 protein C1orf216 homolog isoform X2 n=1 Tax=Cyclopterus lumpus TaxID=8103 RepID=UPI0014869F21|nr:UPF0500 protein C1orf216 homolog isoform X2 [Cyclopterus lumpus]